MSSLHERSHSRGRLGPGLRLLLAAAVVALPVPARADTIIGGSIGYFALKGVDSRSVDDVLYDNLDFLAFDIHDFNNVTFGGELMFGLGNFLEAGVGAGFYQSTVPSVYADFVGADGFEVEQELKLRIMPVTFTARVFPAGRRAPIQPYVGGGVAILAWRYSESGEFVNFNDQNRIFHDTFVDKGNETAPVAFGGVRFPAGDSVLIGGEFRWTGGQADLDPAKGFAGTKIDLGGYTALATVQVRF